jgi:hypothetical protein
LFRKTSKRDFIIEYDEDGNAVIMQSKNSIALNDEMKKNATTYGSYTNAMYGSHGWD